MILNTIRSFEPEYNVPSFFQDLLQNCTNTFKEGIVKHAFKDAGTGPVSFKAIQIKLSWTGSSWVWCFERKPWKSFRT